MSFTHTITKRYQGPGSTIEQTVSQTASGSIEIDEAITNGADRHIVVSWLNANVKSIYILSDQNLTVEWNDSAGADGSVSLLANQALTYQANGYDTNPFVAADVTDLYVTNASGTTANLSIRVLVDATP